MQKLLSIAAFAAIIGLASCSKDDETVSGLPKEDAKEEVTKFSADAVKDLQDLTNSTGMKATTELFSMTSAGDPLPFGGRVADRNKVKTFIHEKGNAIKSIFSTSNGRAKNDEPFIYAQNKGVYEWNEFEGFVRTGDAAIITIKFPTEGSSTNNAKLNLNDYAETTVTDEFGYTSYEPTLIDAEVFVDNSVVASLNLDVDYSSDGTPIQADLAVNMAPFSAVVSFDDSSSSSSSLSMSLKKSTEVLVAAAVNVSYTGAKEEGNVKSVDGFVQLKNLKLQGSINVEGGENSGDDVNLNDFIKLALYSGSSKIGDIVFENEMVDGFEESVAYLRYSDGSKEKVEDLFADISAELDQLEQDLESNG